MLASQYEANLAYAQQCDEGDTIGRRDAFHIPEQAGEPHVYLCGHSLGLQPKRTETMLQDELQRWQQLAVKAHFQGEPSWIDYQQAITEDLAHLVGAKTHEVVAMNGLTVNIHLLLSHFYKPTEQRYKILIEKPVFPSDRYAVISHLRYHGLSAEEALIEIEADPGSHQITLEAIERVLAEQGHEISLLFMSGVNYLTGQCIPMPQITRAAHAVGAYAGFDLAHAAGNVALALHEWQIDFAAWCTYKYINSGPGGIAALYLHEKYCRDEPTWSGWGGHDYQTRFQMPPDFSPIKNNAESWQLSCTPVLPLVCLRASLQDFREVGLSALRERSQRLTGYMEYLLTQLTEVQIITPQDPEARGCQLSLLLPKTGKSTQQALEAKGITVDFREPNIIRAAPVPLYNTFSDVYRFVEALAELL